MKPEHSYTYYDSKGNMILSTYPRKIPERLSKPAYFLGLSLVNSPTVWDEARDSSVSMSFETEKEARHALSRIRNMLAKEGLSCPLRGIVEVDRKGRRWLLSKKKNPDQSGWDLTTSQFQPSEELAKHIPDFREEMKSEDVSPGDSFTIPLAKDYLTETKNRQDVMFVLDKLGIKWKLVTFPDGYEVISFYAPNDIDSKGWSRNPATYISFDIDSDYGASVERADEWLMGIDDFSLSDYSGIEDINFWEEEVYPGMTLFHGTTAKKAPKIMKHGLEARYESRGLTNKDMPSAVFLSPHEGVTMDYGDALIEVDIWQMKQDGFISEASHETGVDEQRHREAIAHLISFDFGLELHFELEQGLDPDTIAIFSDIPPKYLRRII